MTLVTFGSFKKTVLELPRNSGWAAASHEDLFKAWKEWSAALLKKERKNTHAECEAVLRARPKPSAAEVPWTVTDKAGKRGTAAKRSSSAAKKSDIEDTQKIHLELPARVKNKGLQKGRGKDTTVANKKGSSRPHTNGAKTSDGILSLAEIVNKGKAHVKLTAERSELDGELDETEELGPKSGKKSSVLIALEEKPTGTSLLGSLPKQSTIPRHATNDAIAKFDISTPLGSSDSSQSDDSDDSEKSNELTLKIEEELRELQEGKDSDSDDTDDCDFAAAAAPIN